MYKHIIQIGIVIAQIACLKAQSSIPTFQLKQCIAYATEHNPLMQNAVLDIEQTENSNKLATTRVLPKIEANVDYMHSFNIQHIILENGAVPAFTNPALPMGQVISFQLQLQNQMTMAVNASQVLYDASLFAGLKATTWTRELATKNKEKIRIDLIEWITKAYYGVLVSQKQVQFLSENTSRLDSVYNEMQAKFKSGINRKIDLDRMEVSRNNLRQELDKAQKTVELNKAVLAYYMHFSGDFLLHDELLESELNTPFTASTTRIESSILQTQEKLILTEIQSVKGNAFPKLYAFGSSGYNPAATDASNLFQSTRYFNYTYAGVKLSIPIYAGFEHHYKLRNKQLEQQKLHNQITLNENKITLEIQQAQIGFNKNLESLSIQKRNLELARENVRVVQAENKNGIATNLELTNAETDLKEAQNNYFAILFQCFLSKTDLEKAQGNLGK